MRNRWLVNLLLLILVVGLGALMRWELGQAQRETKLTGLLPEDITEIAIERTDKPAIRLVQDAAGWRMESPYAVSANAERIGKLTGIAATAVYRSLPKTAGAERLGLNADSLRLNLNGLVLSFGNVDPIEQRRYVAIGEQVHLIGDGFQHHLIAGAEDYVARAPLPSGFQPSAGNLHGSALSPEQLAELSGLTAEIVEPLGSELSGRLLSLDSDAAAQSLRFLVSADGRSWARLDLRLRYLLATPPPWAVAEEAPQPDTGAPRSRDLSF